MTDLLQVVDQLKADEKWIRKYYADILKVGDILRDAKNSKGAKRRLRELQDGWEKELKKSKVEAQRSPEKPKKPSPEQELLAKWCKITRSYWPGLFWCYSDPRIPRTNNELERLIKDLKRLERFLSRSPNPGRRFVTNAPINAVFINRRNMPGEDFLAKLTHSKFAEVKATLRAAAGKEGVLRGARRRYSRVLQDIVADWGN